MWLFVSGGEIGSSEELLSGGSLIVYPAEGWACTDWITGLKAIRNIRGNTPLFTGKEGVARLWLPGVQRVKNIGSGHMEWGDWCTPDCRGCINWWVTEPKVF